MITDTYHHDQAQYEYRTVRYLQSLYPVSLFPRWSPSLNHEHRCFLAKPSHHLPRSLKDAKARSRSPAYAERLLPLASLPKPPPPITHLSATLVRASYYYTKIHHPLLLRGSQLSFLELQRLLDQALSVSLSPSSYEAPIRPDPIPGRSPVERIDGRQSTTFTRRTLPSTTHSHPSLLGPVRLEQTIVRRRPVAEIRRHWPISLVARTADAPSSRAASTAIRLRAETPHGERDS